MDAERYTLLERTPRMISFKPLLEICKQRKITSYTIKKDNVIGQASWKKIREGGHVDTRTIDALCAYLHCQPGELMEYVEGENQEEQE